MSARAPIAPAEVTLTVADLASSVEYYENSIGLGVTSRENGIARLGVPGLDLLVLEEQPGARPGHGTNTGLFHFALLMPERRAPAAGLAPPATARGHLNRAPGHLVSEALYPRGPDGHRIRSYRDRPPHTR